MKFFFPSIVAAMSLLFSSEQATAKLTAPLSSEGQRNLLASSQWTELGSPISMGTPGSTERLDIDDLIGLGYSVASSKDGKIVAIGAPYADNNKGRVSVYKYDPDLKVWVLLGLQMNGLDRGWHYGYDLALSHTGDVLVVAAPRALSGRGLVSVYRFDWYSLAWEKIGDNIHGQHEMEEFGTSVAVSETGNLIAIGAPRASSKPGAVRIFEFSGKDGNGDGEGSIWEQVGEDILGESENDRAGSAVDILTHNGDAFVAVGALMDLYTEGSVAVYKYEKAVEEWKQFGVRVDGDEFGTEFGRSVSLGHDGSDLILAVGFPGPGIDADSKIKSGAQVYSITEDGDWDFYGQMIFPLEENDNTGYKVSLSYDGQTLAISSPQYGDVGQGLVHVYYKGKDSDEYKKIGNGIMGDENDELGFAIAVSRDGKVVTAATPDAQYVSSFIIGPSGELGHLSPNNMSATAIVSLTFFLICTIAILMVATFKVVVYMRSTRDSSFSSIPTSSNNEYEITHQSLNGRRGRGSRGAPVGVSDSAVSSFPVGAANQQTHIIGEPDSDEEEGSEISYDEDEVDYETHLGKITRDII